MRRLEVVPTRHACPRESVGDRKIERERLVIGALPELSLQIIDAVRERGRVTIGDIVSLTGANRNTVKKHLAMLGAEEGIDSTFDARPEGVHSHSTQKPHA